MDNPFAGHNCYESPTGGSPGFLPGLLPSLSFYKRAFGVVYESNRLVAQGRYDDATWIRYSLRIVRALEEVGVRVTVKGLENLKPLDGPVVYAGNHMSTLETFVLPAILLPHGPITFIVKESLLKYPLFGPVLRNCRPISVGRANPREDLATVLKEGVERLNEGRSVVVFPQTTRLTEFDPSKFNSIAAKLAARAKVELVPLALRTDAWGQGRFIKDMGPINPTLPVDFVFGEPQPPEGKGDAAHKACVEFISGVFDKWGRLR